MPNPVRARTLACRSRDADRLTRIAWLIGVLAVKRLALAERDYIARFSGSRRGLYRDLGTLRRAGFILHAGRDHTWLFVAFRAEPEAA